MFTFFKQRIKSISFALQGIITLLQTQPNARVHLFSTGLVLVAAYFFEVEKWEWVILTICITLVLAAEAFNTSIEFLTDLSSPNIHPLAKQTKDTAAAAVLICTFGAIIIGLLVFTPYLINFWKT